MWHYLVILVLHVLHLFSLLLIDGFFFCVGSCGCLLLLFFKSQSYELVGQLTSFSLFFICLCV